MRHPLPDAGTPWADLKARMADYATGDVRWRDGKTAVYVFNAGPEVEQVQKEAYALFMSENGLGPAAFPSLKRMEEEVVGFGLSLLHGPDEAAGVITSGGTDSITMAVKAARDYARKARGVTGPLNIVLPRSAHPAFDKACAVMEIDAPPFDFELPGVRSMSADLHKYGYCAKGASTVLFRSAELMKFMTFDFRDWPGGRMVTPTLAGTRPGGAISAAWAVMNFLGVEGYRRKHGEVTAAREVIEAGARRLGFTILGQPQLGIVAFSRSDVDCLALWAKMRERGWFTSITTEPHALHLMLSPFHATVADQYLADLAWAVESLKAGATTQKLEARYS